jgi:hypothetical protein
VAMAIGLALYSPWSGQSGDPSRVMIPRPDAR